MRPFQFHLKEHWRYPQSLDSLLPWRETISAHLDLWQNPANVMRGADLHPKDHSIQLFTDAQTRLGRLLRSKFYQGSVVRPGKKATHKCPRVEGSLFGSFKDQCQNQTVLVATDNSTVVAYWRNSLSRDVHSPVEDHNIVPSLSHNIKSQTHSRVSECDSRPSFQVEPSAVNRMVTASGGVQTDLSEVVHSSCRSICYSSEPQTSAVCVSSPRPKFLRHRCSDINWTGLTAYAYPPTAVLQRVIQKIRQCHCLIIVIAPGWSERPWFWDLVQLSAEIPLQLLVSTTLLKQSHNYVFHSSPHHLNLHAWCLGVDNSKNKASLWRWQRELLSLRGHQQGPSASQSWPYLRNGAEKIRWISPLHL